MMHPCAKTAQKNLRSKGDGRITPGRAGENHFVREQRAPLAGLGMVVRRAADEFVVLPRDVLSGAPDAQDHVSENICASFCASSWFGLKRVAGRGKSDFLPINTGAKCESM
jgi:hypothetical protein